MASFQANSNRKQISIILNLIKRDCIDLYQKFYLNKLQLKLAITLYEEFMSQEINTLFIFNNSFSEIVRKHREQFDKFVDKTMQIILNVETPKEQHNNDIFVDRCVYVMFISLQEWLIQGPKGQQFYFMIDINSFHLTDEGTIPKEVFENNFDKLLSEFFVLTDKKMQ